MLFSKDQFPVVVQAYEISNNEEFFIAEQVVNNQTEADAFSTRYTGKLIKARAVSAGENNLRQPLPQKRAVSAGSVILIIVIILVILFAIGYYTGWVQTNLGITF